MINIINGHTVKRFPHSGIWLVDDWIICDTVFDLSQAVGLSFECLIDYLGL